MNGLLELRGYGVAFGERVILAEIDLSIPERGLTIVVGPSGGGKSTLLRTLSGANDANPSLRTWGEAWFGGARLGEGELPALVAQHARLLTGTVLENVVSALPERASLTPLQQRELAARILERAELPELAAALGAAVIDLPLGLQRRLAIARTAAPGPRLLCADEPTSDLQDKDVDPLLALLRREAERRAVLLVTHNQQHARATGGMIALLAGGRVQEVAPAEAFFGAPRTAAAQQFVLTGSCSLPRPDALPEELAEGVEVPPLPPPARAIASGVARATSTSGGAAASSAVWAAGPRGFRWLRRGVLAGTPRPGIIEDLHYDLDALRRVGITTLITLETTQLPEEELGPYGIRGLHLPVEDMGAPTLAAALEHCERVARLVAAGEVVALHCRAGLGRTGTLLAAQLVYEGKSALEALEEVRRIEPRWVQSEDQARFLEQLAAFLGDRGGRPGPTGC